MSSFRAGDCARVLGRGSLLLFCASGLLACAGGKQESSFPVGVSAELREEEKAVEVAKSEVPPETVVRDAKRAFKGLRVADDLQLNEEEAFTFLAEADAICVGERHDDALDHYAQLRLTEALLERQAMRGFELGLGLEMVRERTQSILSAYQEKRLDDEQFEQQSFWATEWGFPIQYYRPQLQTARDGGAGLIALGVPRKLTMNIAQSGVSALSEGEQAELPGFGPYDQEHRALFDVLMVDHGSHGENQPNMDFYYEAQTVWDEAMAARSAEYLQARYPMRKLLIFAGVAHCHRSAIPSRLERRGPLKVVSVLPVAGGKKQSLEGEDASAQIARGYDYQLVFQP